MLLLPSSLLYSTAVYRPMEPTAFLCDVLEHPARNTYPDDDPAERHESLYLNAKACLTESYPEVHHGNVHELLVAKLPTYHADGVSAATLAVYNLACDGRLQGVGTSLEVDKALKQYPDRPLKQLSGRFPAAVTA